MVFDKRRRQREEREWVWKWEKIEEVREFIYLGFLLRKNGDIKGHVRERVKKGNDIIMKKVWGIEEKIFQDDFKRRMRFCDTLVLACVLLYGVEIWGWKEYEEIQRLHERYIRWTLGLDRCTPWYIVLKEVDRKKIRTGNRACKFEEKVLESQSIEE